MTEKRLSYIDISRGIALILVVFGHLFKLGSNTSRWIFSFHMPIFFIISGYVTNTEKYNCFKDYFIKKLKQLILPYFGCLLFGFIISIIIKDWRSGVLSLNALEQAFYYTQPELFHVGQIWFLVVLFNTSIAFYFIDKFITSKIDNKKKLLVIILLIFVALIALGYCLKNPIKLFEFSRLPFKIDLLPMSLFFMLFGKFLKKFLIIDYFISDKIIKLSSMLLFLTINIVCGVLINGYVNICDCIYDNIYVYIIAALTGSLFIIILSSILYNFKPLKFYGKNSLFMFSIHSMLLYLAEVCLSNIYDKDIHIMVNIPYISCFITGILIMIVLYIITKIKNCIFKFEK